LKLSTLILVICFAGILVDISAVPPVQQNITLENRLIKMVISPQKGARVFELYVQGSGNLAHSDYGFFSDHPIVDKWDLFRNLPYKLVEADLPERLIFKASGGGIELTKEIRLHAAKPLVTISYQIKNIGSSPVELRSACASFLKVPASQTEVPVVAFWKSKDGSLELIDSGINVYKKFPATETMTLGAYYPQLKVQVVTETKNPALREVRIGAASKSYLSLEQHFEFKGLQPGDTVKFSITQTFTGDAGPPPGVKQHLAECKKRMKEYENALKEPVKASYPEQRLGISGAFYSFWDVAIPISANRELAQKEMQAMKDIGLDTVIFETGSRIGLIYKSKYYKTIKGCENTLDNLIHSADAVGLRVILSLPAINSAPFLLEEDELSKFEELVKKLAEELYDKYGKIKAVSGWYIPFEISDAMLWDKSDKNRIAEFYRRISAYLRQLAPDLPVSIAPYFYADVPPSEFKAIWKDFLNLSTVDVLMIQDSVGALNVSGSPKERLKLLPPFLKALNEACAETKVKFWLDLEIFEQIHGPPLDGEPWSARVADFERIRRQLEIGQQFVEKIVCYEFAHYLSPNGIIPTTAESARQLYYEYMTYRVKPISGTFFQPSPHSPLKGNLEKWNAMFSEMKSLGMDTFIIQWTVRNNVALYSSDLSWIKEQQTDILKIALDMAKKWGFDVIIGLDFSDRWWKNERGYLEKVAEHNLEIIKEIKAKYLPHPHFKGWYIPQEISNYTSTIPNLEPEIRDFLIRMGKIRDKETPSATLSLAPFFNATVDSFSSADEYAQWWKRVATGTGLDIIMLQDGIGAHPVSFEKMQSYFIALRRELKESNISLWSDLEIFEFVGKGKNRRLLPAEFERVKGQLLSESLLVDKIVCFAYPNYAFSILGDRQKALHDQYAEYIQHIVGRAEKTKRKN